MNGDDEIQARRDERAKWEKRLKDARADYKAAVSAPHLPGRIGQEIQAVADASERICNALFKINWLRWCDEMDEGRRREETGV